MSVAEYPVHSGKKFIIQLVMDKDFRQKVIADKENMINNSNLDSADKAKLMDMDLNALGSTSVDDVDSFLNDSQFTDGCW